MLLSRTAENLFWLARYVERAETTARLLGVGAHTALLPSSGDGFRNEWESVLLASGTAQAFADKYGRVRERDVITHLFFDSDNGSSVASCITQARENGRIVRSALTSQMWDVLNVALSELRDLQRVERSRLELSDLIDWTMRVAALVHGTMELTHLRNDGHDFLHLGYYTERADATARLLDVKYYVLLPQVELVGSQLDNYQWKMLLRAMSAHRAFAWVYGGEITSHKVADFLILNRRCPRALITSMEGVAGRLDRLARGYSHDTAAQAKARQMHDALGQARIEDVQSEGLHEFLRRHIDDMAALSVLIDSAYFSGRPQ